METARGIAEDFTVDAPTPLPAKRSMGGRKRKAAVDLEAEAEEHQKRREVQYQSLLAPLNQSPIAAATTTTAAATTPVPTVVDTSFPSFPIPDLVDVQPTATPAAPPTPQNQTAEPASVAGLFGDSTRPLSDMENMGYDQVYIVISLFSIVIYLFYSIFESIKFTIRFNFFLFQLISFILWISNSNFTELRFSSYVIFYILNNFL